MANGPLLHCVVCYDDLSLAELAHSPCKQCHVEFCTHCLQRAFEVAEEDDTLEVRCPNPHCSQILNAECMKVDPARITDWVRSERHTPLYGVLETYRDFSVGDIVSMIMNHRNRDLGHLRRKSSIWEDHITHLKQQVKADMKSIPMTPTLMKNESQGFIDLRSKFSSLRGAQRSKSMPAGMPEDINQIQMFYTAANGARDAGGGGDSDAEQQSDGYSSEDETSAPRVNSAHLANIMHIANGGGGGVSQSRSRTHTPHNHTRGTTFGLEAIIDEDQELIMNEMDSFQSPSLRNTRTSASQHVEIVDLNEDNNKANGKRSRKLSLRALFETPQKSKSDHVDQHVNGKTPSKRHSFSQGRLLRQLGFIKSAKKHVPHTPTSPPIETPTDTKSRTPRQTHTHDTLSVKPSARMRSRSAASSPPAPSVLRRQTSPTGVSPPPNNATLFAYKQQLTQLQMHQKREIDEVLQSPRVVMMTQQISTSSRHSGHTLTTLTPLSVAKSSPRHSPFHSPLSLHSTASSSAPNLTALTLDNAYKSTQSRASRITARISLTPIESTKEHDDIQLWDAVHGTPTLDHQVQHGEGDDVDDLASPRTVLVHDDDDDDDDDIDEGNERRPSATPSAEAINKDEEEDDVMGVFDINAHISDEEDTHVSQQQPPQQQMQLQTQQTVSLTEEDSLAAGVSSPRSVRVHVAHSFMTESPTPVPTPADYDPRPMSLSHDRGPTVTPTASAVAAGAPAPIDTSMNHVSRLKMRKKTSQTPDTPPTPESPNSDSMKSASYFNRGVVGSMLVSRATSDNARKTSLKTSMSQQHNEEDDDANPFLEHAAQVVASNDRDGQRQHQTLGCNMCAVL